MSLQFGADPNENLDLVNLYVASKEDSWALVEVFSLDWVTF